MRLRFALPLLVLLFSGCLDVDNEWTLNPDGSGKVRHRVVFNQKAFSFGTEKSPREFARELLEKSEGIEAWGDLSYGKTDEGYLRFEGVAYFPDASAIRLEHEVVKTRFRREGGALIASFTGDKGNLGLEGLLGESSGGLSKSESASGFRMTLRMMRMQLGSMKAFLKGRDRVRLPGQLAPGHAGKLKEGALEVAFSFQRMNEFLDAVEKDPQLLAVLRARSNRGAKGNPSPALDPAKVKEFETLAANFMVGGDATEARSLGGKPAFDYADAVTAAKTSSAKAYDAVGYAVPGRPGKALAGFELAGLQYVHEKSADKQDFEYQGDFAPHVHFHFGGTLGEKPLKLLGGRLTRVVATDGTSLLLDAKTRELEGVQRPGSLRFTFGAIARLTSSCAGGYEEVSGYVEYLLASGKTEDVDLGLAAFSKGAKGTQYGAELEEVDAGSLSLKLVGLEESEIAGITLVDAKGQAFPLEDAGGWSMGSELTKRLRPEGRGVTWPAKGKLVLTLHRGRTRHRVPFKLVELDAQGVSRAD
jgi:hypothetical protein